MTRNLPSPRRSGVDTADRKIDAFAISRALGA